MRALELVASWPVPYAAAVVVAADGTVLDATGDIDRRYALASMTKMLTAWAVLVAVEEGTVALDDPIGQPDCTLRHLLAHAGGYSLDDRRPVRPPAERRIYSNAGIELATEHVQAQTGLAFAGYLGEAVLGPLGMTATELVGSPAHGARSTARDMARFLAEAQRSALLDPATAAAASQPHYPTLAGIVPGVGRFDPCPWGLGFEVRGGKSPHWTGRTNSPSTFGHFGASGTMAWIDPAAAVALVALTDWRYDEWSADALRLWPALSDAVLAEMATA
ncbi:MAG: beta-lactamase family protein [Acidimicrobiia bacterium]|nr:beta-lactamase family protein [Acidimicrobiia bacterium]